jgi:hypothetical protein
MSRILNFKQFVNERADVEIPHKKGHWVVINPVDYKDLKDEFFNLITTAYKEIGGHFEVHDPNDVFNKPDWNYFVAADVDVDKDFDVVSVSKKTPFGKKMVAIGHDGSREAKDTYIKHEIKAMKTPGNYAEVSGKVAHILIDKNHVNVIENPDEVREILNKPITWLGKHPDGKTTGNGWYERTIAGVNAIKTMVGEPTGYHEHE